MAPKVPPAARVRPAPTTTTLFGLRVRQERKGRKLTQDDVATAIDCARTTITMIESGAMATFTDPEFYVKLARVLGGTAENWQNLAEQGRPVFSLPGHGEGVTEEHRKTAVLLERNWADLTAAAMRAIKQAAIHDLTKAGKTPK